MESDTETQELEHRISAAKARLAQYIEDDKLQTLAHLKSHKLKNKIECLVENNLALLETFKQSDITINMAINIIAGSICLGLVFMIIYGQIYGCSTGCGVG